MGKWEVIYDHGWHVVDVTDKSPGGQILICDCGIDPWSEMNAHKIAAAPELAEALKALIDAADTSDDCQYGTLATSFVRNICIAALTLADPQSPPPPGCSTSAGS